MIPLQVEVPERAGSSARARAWARLAVVIRRQWLAILFAGSAVFAGVTAVVSNVPPEQQWGAYASVGYAMAALVAAMAPRRGQILAVIISFAGALLVPLGWMVSAGVAQPEVGVITRSAAMFLHRGTPYQGLAALAVAHNPNAYDPYLPALVMFGVPRAVLDLGPFTDPRVLFGLVFALSFGAALAVAGVGRPGWCAALVTASPAAALELSVGGDDLAVLGLMCLGLAIAGRAGGRRGPLSAGLVMGLAAAMKATAWPALGVVALLLAARRGGRAAAAFALAAIGVAVAADGPILAAQPGPALANTVLFPLGLAKVKSPAASALPGHLIASSWSGGHWVALGLIAAAGLIIAARLAVRPPRTAQEAGWWLALGLTVLFLLAPASRVGYFIYPLGLASWLLLVKAGRAPARAPTPPAEGAQRAGAGACTAAASVRAARPGSGSGGDR